MNTIENRTFLLLTGLVVLFLLSYHSEGYAMHTEADEETIHVKIVFLGLTTDDLRDNLMFLWVQSDKADRSQLVELDASEPILRSPKGNKIDAGKILIFDVLSRSMKPYRGKSFRLHFYANVAEPAENTFSKQLAWGQTAIGTDGIVFVVDCRKEKIADSKQLLGKLKQEMLSRKYRWENLPIVFQLTHSSDEGALPPAEVKQTLGLIDNPVVVAEPSKGKGVLETTRSLISQIRKGLEEGRLRHMPTMK